jgi:hypothetical protein
VASITPSLLLIDGGFNVTVDAHKLIEYTSITATDCYPIPGIIPGDESIILAAGAEEASYHV